MPTPTGTNPTSTASPPNPAGGIEPTLCDQDFDKFDADESNALSYDEYVNGRYGQIRWFKAPTAKEEADMKATLAAEAKAADENDDQKLSREEYATTCK
jgi:hypothetical protein